MPRKRKDETEKGLFSIETGERPFVVRVREGKERGSKLTLDYREPGTKSRRVVLVDPPLRVRDGKGRIDPELVELAKDAGRKRSAELRLGVLEQEVGPERITVREAFRRYMDPITGGMSRSRAPAYRRARDAWTAFLIESGRPGADTPWNRTTPADVWGFASKLKEAGKVPTALAHVKCISAVYHWLARQARVRGLENPVDGFDWERLERGYEPRRERFTIDQVRALLEVRYRVEPRFALFLALSTQSITRSVEIRNIRRSDVDRPRPMPPLADEAPFGWLFFPGVKGQDAGLHFLTRFQREELFAAFVGYDDPITGEWRTGYLRELERRWLADRVDYPLFPARRLKRGIMPPDRPSAQKTIAHLRPREWLAEAERLAGVLHVEWRSWHGVRRAVSDFLEAETDLGTLTAVGRWKSQATPERIYLDRKQYRKNARGRKALEEILAPKTPRTVGDL